MTSFFAWALAAAALFVGWRTYGWPGVIAALTVIVFWLLLHFNRAMRAMKNAAHRPVGHVDSAVMLNARLHKGMTLIQVLALTRSLGVQRSQTAETCETWEWADASGSRVRLEMARGRLQAWHLDRPEPSGNSASPTP